MTTTAKNTARSAAISADVIAFPLKAQPKSASGITRPNGDRAEALAFNRIVIQWLPVAGAERYLIEKQEKTRDAKPFAQIAAIAETEFLDKHVFPETTYAYRIRAVSLSGATSAYTKPITAKTFKRIPQFRQMWLKTFLDGDRDMIVSDDPDTACTAAALKASADLANTLPEAVGRGWNIQCDIVIEGYEACKKKLADYIPSKGDLSGYLYGIAETRIKNAAQELFTVHGKRSHGHKDEAGNPVKLPSVVSTDAEAATAEGDALTPGMYAADANEGVVRYEVEISRADTAFDLERMLSTLPEADQALMFLRLKDQTFAQIAEVLGGSPKTIERRIKEIESRLGSSFKLPGKPASSPAPSVVGTTPARESKESSKDRYMTDEQWNKRLGAAADREMRSVNRETAALFKKYGVERPKR